MKIGFAGQLYGSRIKETAALNKNTVSYAIQKFNENLVIALEHFADIEVYAPIMNRLSFFKEEKEKKKNFHYLYYNGKLGRLKLIGMSFFSTLFAKNDVIFVDALNISQAIGIIMAKLFCKSKMISIITDIPEDVLTNKNTLYGQLFKKILNKSDAFVFLTEQSNIDYNKNNKPYVIIEGIAQKNKCIRRMTDEKICIYAGGLSEKYFIKQLVDAFVAVAKDKECLYIFGDGECRDYVMNISAKSDHINYMGTAVNSVIMQYETDAILLINPRPNIGDYTKYSFPSKLIEYMTSRTPSLGNKLDGIPDEYYQKMFVFDGITCDEYAKTIRKILDMPVKELGQKGAEAEKFILERNGISNTIKKIQELFDAVKFN